MPASDYPLSSALPVNLGSSCKPHDNSKSDDSGDGIQRVRKINADVRSWTLIHERLSAAQAALLRTHYATYGTGSFIFTSPFFDDAGSTYDVQYVGAPVPKNEEASDMSFTVMLSQVP